MSRQRLRTGYTTGTCAAAAAKAACWMLLHQQNLEQVRVKLPLEQHLLLDIKEVKWGTSEVSCCVIKDSGDDPDITNGMAVWAKVKWLAPQSDTTDQCLPFIRILGGDGVGTVTLKGLQVQVGEPAINPVPRQMIEDNVREVLEERQAVEVTIFLPEGARLAKKTFNERLGVVGGLSILGTTGIVWPMSEEALKETIELELKVQAQLGHKKVCLVPGHLGEVSLKKAYTINEMPVVTISNYLGFALETSVSLGYKEVGVAGHIGKLIKPAGGIFQTHNRISTTRMEILVAHLALLGMPLSGLEAIMGCITTDEAVTVIANYGFEQVYKILANKASDYCQAYVFDELKVAFALFSMKERLGVSDGFEEFLQL